MKKISARHIGHEHSDWLRSLDFYRQELDILKNRLTEIGGRNTGKEVAVKLEQYENQMAIQRNNIDQLQHDIHSNVRAISEHAQLNGAMYVDTDLSDRHRALGDAVSREERTVNELRKDFNQFSAEWM